MPNKSIILIGAGRWGQRYLETLKQFPVDVTIANRSDWAQLLDRKPSGAVIATPPESHVEIATYCIENKIPCIVEKPLALSLKEAETLKPIYRPDVPILVNHIHLFSDQYRAVKKAAAGHQIESITTYGFGSGPVRNISSLWDYGPHDVAMVLDLVGRVPNHVTCQNRVTKTGTLHRITMNFGNFVSTSLVGNGANHSERSLEIKFDGIEMNYNDKTRPKNITPPLINVVDLFLKAIDGVEDSRLGLDLSFNVLKILEQCSA